MLNKSTVNKRSIVIGGHKTSVSLEPEFWAAVQDLAARHNLTLSALVKKIDDDRETHNLSSAIRVTVLKETQDRVTA